MRKILIGLGVALLLVSCSDIGTTPGDELILFAGDSFPVQSTVSITVINNTGEMVYGNSCPGFLGEKLEGDRWVAAWQTIDDCTNIFVEPYEFEPNRSVCLCTGPVIDEPGIYRVSLETWRDGDSLVVTTVYSQPFTLYEE